MSNRGGDTPTRDTQACLAGPAPISVRGTSGLPAGRQWEGLAADFKATVVADAGGFGGATTDIGQFEDISIDPNMGCGLMARTGPFNPGEQVQSVLAWNAAPSPGRQIGTGHATVRAEFASSAGMLAAETAVEFRADSEQRATLVDYIDIALAEASFRDWLMAQPRAKWDQPALSFWTGQYPPGEAYSKATGQVASVSLTVLDQGEWSRGEVVIDVATGSVLGTQWREQPTPTPSFQ